MNLTLQEGLALLLSDPKYRTPEGLLELVRSMSVNTPADGIGRTPVTLAYSGSTGPAGTGPATGSFAEYVAKTYPNEVRVINNAPVGQLIASDAFQEAALRAFGRDPVAYNNWLNEATRGPWAEASRNFMQAAPGPIELVGPYSPSLRTFTQVEIEAGLRSNAPTIAGVPREQLGEFRDALLRTGSSEVQANARVGELLSLGSRLQDQSTRVAWTAEANGSQRIVWADVSRLTGTVPGTPIPEGAIRATLGELAGPVSSAERAGYQALAGLPQEVMAPYRTALERTGATLGTVGGVLALASLADMAFKAKDAYAAGRPDDALEMVRDWSLGNVGAALVGGMVFSGVGSMLAPLSLLGPLGIGVAVVAAIGTSLLGAYLGYEAGVAIGRGISDLVRSLFLEARDTVTPIVLDMDGDGIETVGLNAGVLFDHNADGIKTVSGWVRPDDALLAWDRNGNGKIDSGRELFGNHSLRADGSLAYDGWAALSAADGNTDGLLTQADAAFAQLRVWQDLDQDGTSDAGELRGLAAAGITKISVARESFSEQRADGNRLDGRGSFVVNGQARTFSDVWFAEDRFHSQFIVQAPVHADVQALPDAQGAGAVLGLRQAASQSATLRSVLKQFDQAATREEQLVLLDRLLSAWADTSGMRTSRQVIEQAGDKRLFLQIEDALADSLTYQRRLQGVNVQTQDPFFLLASAARSTNRSLQVRTVSVAEAEYEHVAGVLERFNGTPFIRLASETQAERGVFQAAVTRPEPATIGLVGPMPVVMDVWQGRYGPLWAAYEALRESVFSALVIQTDRIERYANSVRLTVAASGVQFDFAGLNALIAANGNASPSAALKDMRDLFCGQGPSLVQAGWDATVPVRALASKAIASGVAPAELAKLGVTFQTTPSQSAISYAPVFIFGNDAAQVSYGSYGNDVVDGAGDNDTLYGNDGDDLVSGGLGNDRIYGDAGDDEMVGGSGDDTLSGGLGNDRLGGSVGSDSLRGGTGNDTYLFGRGSGQDTIYNDDATQQDVDAVLFAPSVLPSDVAVHRSANELVMTIAGTSDRLTLNGFFYFSSTAVKQFRFADGTVWTLDDVKLRALVGNATAQTITGYESADAIAAAAGDDTVFGLGGNDTLGGGAGADKLYGGDADDLLGGGTENDQLDGGSGNDTLLGGTGVDLLYGGIGDDSLQGNEHDDRLAGDAGNDTLDGGSGNDYLAGGAGADVYRFGQGSGQDTVYDFDSQPAAANIDSILFGAGVTTFSVTLALTRSSGDLTIRLNGSDDSLRVQGYFTADGAAGYAVENLRFADGTVWDVAAVKAKMLIGTVGNDTLYGYATGDTINGNEGNDVIYGHAGNDTLNGGAGADTMAGETGDDIYVGGAGNDTLNDSSTSSNDTYHWGVGQGSDTISDVGGTADRIKMATGITGSQIKLTRSGNNVIVGMTGSTDTLTVTNWYASAANKIEQISLADGSVITMGTAAPLAVVRPPASDLLRMQTERRPFKAGWEAALNALTAPDQAPHTLKPPQAMTTMSRVDGDRYAQLLVQAMAQFDGGDAAVDLSAPLRWRQDPAYVTLATPT